MTRHLYAAVGVAAISGVALAAQTPAPSQPGTMDNMQVTLTGCVQSWTPPASAGSTAGATAPGGMNDIRFRLTDAEKKDGAAMGRSGATTPGATTPGATGTTPSPTGARAGAMDEDEYLLRAEGASVNLSQHLNHQVEVTGRVMPSRAGTSGAAGTSTPAGTSGTATTPRSPETGASTMRSAMGGDAPVLTVSSIKMIANTCK